MKLLYLIPIAIAGLVFLGVQLLRKKYPTEQFKQTMQMIGLFFCTLAIIATVMSYYYSGDKAQLYKISLPVIIIILTMEQIRRNNPTRF